jgi:hypothetical protein
LDAGFKAICTHRSKARRRETGISAQRPEDAIAKSQKRSALGDRVNLHFVMEENPTAGNVAMVTLGEMKNSEKFRFVADGGEPPA